MPRTSVTIEAVTPVTAAYISRQDAERWLAEDMNILSLVSSRIAFKLYRSSYSKGTRLFYPPSYMLLDYLVKYGDQLGFGGPASPSFIIISKTRQILQEELGINVKTLNRTIRQLKEEGFFREEDPLPMSMEVTVMDGESEDAVLAGTKRAFNRAWALL